MRPLILGFMDAEFARIPQYVAQKSAELLVPIRYLDNGSQS